MTFSRFIVAAWICLSLSACVPGMAPKGTLSNPAGAKAPAEEIEAPFGPKDESSSATEIPSSPSGAVPRSLEVPAPPPLEGPKAGPGPVAAGGGGGYNDGATQMANSGGGFCPKPDEVTLDDLANAKDWRAFHGFGAYWTELSKTEPASRAVGEGVPFDLYLNVQGYYDKYGCAFWGEPVAEEVTVRLIFKSAALALAVTSHADAPVNEKTADGYNTVFRGIIASDGLIDVYAYVGSTPPADDTVFVADTARAHYLGSFATRVTVTETIRDKTRIRTPY